MPLDLPKPLAEYFAASVPDTDFVAADVPTPDGCPTVVDAVRDRFGGVDVVVHVVGGSSAPAGGFAVLDDREWECALDLSLLPTVRWTARCCRQCSI